MLVFQIFFKLPCSIPAEPDVRQWRLNLTFRWIVNHDASSLGCRHETQFPYRPVVLPTSPCPAHLLGLSYQPKAREVRTERVFPPGSVVCVVDGLLTKSPLSFELDHLAIELMDQWFLIPTHTIPQHFSIKFMRGQPVGAFIRMSSRSEDGDVIYSHLPDEIDRMWMMCRETKVFHWVRPVAAIATQYLDRKVYLRSKNALKCPLTLSCVDRKRMTMQSPPTISPLLNAESVTDSASNRGNRDLSDVRRSVESDVDVPKGPWMNVLNGTV